MANNNSIVEIPLQAELCLNKNKIDITSFNGFSKKNSQLYGDVLSPLFKKQIDNHDYFDSYGNYYDINDTEIKKNGVSLFSYNNKGIQHYILEKKHDAIAFGENKYIYADEGTIDGQIKYKVSSYSVERTITISNCSIIRKIKCFISESNNIGGFIVWYINTSGDESVYIRTSDLINVENYYNSDFEFDIGINNPFIQCYVTNNKDIVISLFNNKGTELTEIQTVNFIIKNNTLYKNIVFNATGTTDTVINTSIKNIKILPSFTQNITAITSGMGASLSGTQSYEIKISESWEKNIVVKHYHAYNNTTETLGTITAGNTSISGTIATLSGTSSNAIWSGNTKNFFDKNDYLLIETQSAPEGPTEDQRTENTFIDVSFKIDSTNVYKTIIQNNSQQSGYNNNFVDYKTVSLFSYEESELEILHNVNAVMDDGLLINTVFTAENYKLEQKTNVISGVISNIAYSGNTATLNYTINSKLDFLDSLNYPKYMQKVIFNLTDYYYRICFILYSEYDEETETFTNDKYIMFDSASNKLFYGAGVNTGTYNNNIGTSKNVSDNIRLLFNNNYVAGISCYENENNIGTILNDWFSLSDDCNISVAENRISYVDNQNKINVFEITEDAEWKFKVIEKKYIIINTISYLNCYDIESGKPCHYATDYNNRCIPGIKLNRISYSDECRTIFEQKTRNSVLFASGINSNYEITKNYLPSIQLGAVLYDNVILDQETIINGDSESQNGESIDLYLSYGEESTTAIYINSIKNGLKYKKPDLIDAYYPVSTGGNILYSPNLFTKYIETFNNRDMLVSSSTSYTLLYSNAQPVLLYRLLSGVDNMSDVFVLQTSYYGVSDNKIFELVYDNGVISSATAIGNIKGMQYLGALPNMALFWSESNKTMYSFTGDAILSPLKQANEIGIIRKTAYNPATQEIFLFADNNIIVISTSDSYKLELFNNPSDIFFVEDNYIVIDDDNTIMISYNRKEEFETNKIRITTKYYGIGNNVPVNYDCWYIRLTNEGIKENGSVKLHISTITDKGFESEDKEFYINASDWDELTDSIYLRYQPKYQKGIGACLSLETEFPIVSLHCSYTTFDGAAQIAKHNI